MKKWFMNLSLKTKICLSVYVVTAVSFLGLVLLVSNVGARDLMREKERSAAQAAAYGNLLMDKEQSYLLGMASHYAINNEIQNMIRLSNSGIDSAQLSAEIIAASESRMYVLSLVFYNLKGEVVESMAIDASHGAVPQDPGDADGAFGQLIRRQRTYAWEFIPKDSDRLFEQDNSPKMCLWYLVTDNASHQPIGAFAITFDARKLLSTHGTTETAYDTILAVTRDGLLVDGKGPDYTQFSQESRMKLVENTPDYIRNGDFLLELEGTEYYVSYAKLFNANITTYALIAKQAHISENRGLYFGIVGVGLCLLLLFPQVVLCVCFITKPLDILSSKMARFASGDRTVRVYFKSGDEIGQLGHIFNEMVESNNRLIEKTYELTIRRQRAELTALQAQIDPHFIYNMLNLIQWTAYDSNEPKLGNMVNTLARVIRYNLNRGDEFVTMMQELEQANCFCQLQEYRMANSLSVSYDVEQDARNVVIPKLTIQPLVENAILHGMRPDKRPLKLCIKGRRSGNGLYIEVSDDGVGIPPDMLEAIRSGDYSRQSGQEEYSNRFAIKNILERLELYYGPDKYQFHISSTENVGTAIEIRIPYLTRKPPLPGSVSDAGPSGTSESDKSGKDEKG